MTYDTFGIHIQITSEIMYRYTAFKIDSIVHIYNNDRAFIKRSMRSTI